MTKIDGTIGVRPTLVPVAMAVLITAMGCGGSSATTVSCEMPGERRCYEYQGLTPSGVQQVRDVCPFGPGVFSNHPCVRDESSVGCEAQLSTGKRIVWEEKPVTVGASWVCDGTVVGAGANGGATGSIGAGGARGTGGVRGTGGTPGTGGGTGGGRGGSSGGAGGAGGELPPPPAISGPPPPAGCPAVGFLASGTSDAVGLVKTATGTIVILDDGILSFDGAGQRVAALVSPRQIVSVASSPDGARIVVADKAIATVYGPDLAVTAKFTTAESCSSGIVVSGGRFVCGPAVDWDRLFYVYDMATGALLASSGLFTYQGLAMRSIPGSDDFITMESSLSVYHVGADNLVTSVLNSFSGSVSYTQLFAFDGVPPKHMITQNGDLLTIGPAACASTTNVVPPGCLVKDGQLGTLRSGQGFAAMTNDAAGQVFGLVTSGGSDPFASLCSGGCSAQHVDSTQRLVVSERAYTLGDLSTVRGLVVDERCGQLIVAYALAARSAGPLDPPAGYRVAVLSYQ